MLKKLSFFMTSFICTGSLFSSQDFDLKESNIRQCLIESQKYHDFEKDFLDVCIGLEKQGQIDYRYTANEIILFANKISHEMAEIKKIQNGSKSLDEVLFLLLDERFHDIKCDAKEKKKYRHIHINDTVRSAISEDTKNTFFQYRNRMISYLFMATTPDQLSAKTRRQIRLSPSLWPLLSQQTKNLGSPNKTTEDLKNFDTYVDTSERLSIQYRGLGAPKKMSTQHVTPFERSQVDKHWEHYGKIPELAYPEWLNPAVLKQNALELKTKNSLKTLGNEDSDPMITLDQKKEYASLESQKPLSIIIDEKDEPRQEPEGLESPQVDIFEPKVEASPRAQEVTKPAQEPNSTKHLKKKKEQESLAPKGSRLFHENDFRQDFQTNRTIETIKGKHLSTLQAIFDAKQYRNVSYRQVKGLWQHINGKNSLRDNTGSSHKVLLDAQGQTVTGIFSHGENMCYTKRTIPYIREAFQKIGFGLQEN